QLETTLGGGIVGLVFDTRGRPLTLPEEENVRNETIMKWWKALDLYPSEQLQLR
ncbi:MAG: hypothetical protein GWN17_05530, partial [Candidatus Korarchaeota archaeon]|nr:hypothetical protein [Candidatus Thorarchaeota archaeon]NIW51676.1 hypothetical protein [Candidatus Korarchaeota archaeon]